MFTDESQEPCEFLSTWKKERYVRDTAMQTKEMSFKDRKTQAVKQADGEAQTEDEIREDIRLYEDDSPELLAFLRKMEPLVAKELEKNKHSHAFDGYSPVWDEETTTVKCLHTLNHAGAVDPLPVTSVSWNSTGSVIAVSYGRFDHEDWCTHRSMLCTWNLSRRKVDAAKADISIDLASCLMCIACHPKNPSWIAGGTFNGEVSVWDVGRDDDMLLASSGIGDDSHREAVSKVAWVLDPDSHGQKYNLVSVSGDGRILVWRLFQHQKSMQLTEGFVLLTESLPKQLKVKTNQQMGVTCISFSRDDETSFLIGSDSGGIFRCSTKTQGTPAGKEVQCSVSLRSPVSFAFTPHDGPVHSVDSSPFHRNLFVSCSTDMSARIYSVLQARPIVTLEPNVGYLHSVSWSPVRPTVLATSTASGQVFVYDLKQKRSAAVLELDASPKKVPVYSIQFNTKQSGLLACGDALGCVTVWKLNDELTQQTSRDQDVLNEIAESTQE